MSGRFVRPHEGMTRTQSPRRGIANRRAPVTLLAVFLMLVTIALAWSVLSGAGGYEEARAQSSGGDELAQSPTPSESGDTGTEDAGDSYAAFGEPKNPFERVVPLAQSESGDTNTSGDGEDGSTEGGDESDDGSSNSPGDATGSSADDGAGNGAGTDSQGGPGSTNPPAPGGGATGAGSDGEPVDCSGLEDFERVICEDERGSAGNAPEDASPGAQGAGNQQGPPGSGGTGRSGADEPAEQFRNGGGGAVK